MPGGSFAANLRTARESRGFTMAELSQRADLDISAVSRLEAGQRQPTLPSVIALAAVLGMTGSALLEGL